MQEKKTQLCDLEFLITMSWGFVTSVLFEDGLSSASPQWGWYLHAPYCNLHPKGPTALRKPSSLLTIWFLSASRSPNECISIKGWIYQSKCEVCILWIMALTWNENKTTNIFWAPTIWQALKIRQRGRETEEPHLQGDQRLAGEGGGTKGKYRKHVQANGHSFTPLVEGIPARWFSLSCLFLPHCPRHRYGFGCLLCGCQ